jgi:hypothetical protein
MPGTRRVLRIALTAIGLSAAVYAGASLTGGWLGTPPWWWAREREWQPVLGPMIPGPGGELSLGSQPGHFIVNLDELDGKRVRRAGEYGWVFLPPRPGRELISAAVMLSGLALLAWAAWPRGRARSCQGASTPAL